MPSHFFLSYSRADQSPLVKRFFDDLSDTIRIESGMPPTQAVGFYEEVKYGPTSDWSKGAKEALQNSAMMVCLLSPAYLHCERTGKEWRLFETRWRRSFDARESLETLPESLAHVIVPVTWISWHGPVPRVVGDMLAHPDRIYQRQALTTMFKSSGMSNREYADFVKALASQIIEMTPAASHLLPLDVPPEMGKVHNAFHLWEEPPRRTNVEFVKSIQPEETTPPVPPTPQRQPASTSHTITQNIHRVFAISKDKKTLDRIEECCRFSIFDLKKYDDHAQALQDTKEHAKQSRELLPDLFVIDLDNGMPGLEVTKTLSETLKVPSEILVISDDFEESRLRSFKRYTLLQKSYLEDQLFDLMKKGAEFGRNRSEFRKKRERDPLRFERPVFLSFCHKDEVPADFLVRNLEARSIGVWSMNETLRPGDDWYAEIVDGLEKARVFIALVTEDYLSSMDCRAEFDSFHVRAKRERYDERRPYLIPVLYNKPEVKKYEFMEKKLNSHHYVRMSDDEYVDELDDFDKPHSEPAPDPVNG